MPQANESLEKSLRDAFEDRMRMEEKEKSIDSELRKKLQELVVYKKQVDFMKNNLLDPSPSKDLTRKLRKKKDIVRSR